MLFAKNCRKECEVLKVQNMAFVKIKNLKNYKIVPFITI